MLEPPRLGAAGAGAAGTDLLTYRGDISVSIGLPARRRLHCHQGLQGMILPSCICFFIATSLALPPHRCAVLRALRPRLVSSDVYASPTSRLEVRAEGAEREHGWRARRLAASPPRPLHISRQPLSTVQCRMRFEVELELKRALGCGLPSGPRCWDPAC